MTERQQNALITGASAGLGRALASTLAADGWQLTIDGRRPGPLEQTRRELAARTRVQAVAGDITDPAHRRRLVEVASTAGPLDLVVNNASELGGSPPPHLRDLDPEIWLRVFTVDVAAPLELLRLVLPRLSRHAVIVNVSSDAAVEHYEGWGGYGAAKAALDHLTLTWAAEEPDHTWYAVDPGDMRTEMHQAAFPGEDISDRPEPAEVVPALLRLVGSGLPSGRYRAAELADEDAAAADRVGAAQGSRS